MNGFAHATRHTVDQSERAPQQYCDNQAYMCKTLGVVTTPKSIASTRNNYYPHARKGRAMQRACCTRIRTNFMLSCKSRKVPRFLALEPVGFSTTAAYSFVFAVWGAIIFASLYEKYLLLSTATKMA